MLTIQMILLLVLVAIVAGIYSNIGLGGGVLYVPLLLWLTEIDRIEAVLLSLVLVVFTSIPSVWNHMKEEVLDMKTGLTLEGGSIIGAVAGVIFNLSISDYVFVLFFSAVLVFSGIKMTYDTKKGLSADKERPELLTGRNIAIAILLSTFTGFISASMGIGGGVINVLMLVCILGFSAKRAAGTSSFKTVFTATAGIGLYLLSGVTLHTDMAILLAPVVFGASYGGSRLGLKKLKGSSVRVLFIGGLFLAAAKMLLELV